jgi:hypothetical protein
MGFPNSKLAVENLQKIFRDPTIRDIDFLIGTITFL